MAIWFGYNPPFINGRTILPLQQDARLIKNDLLQLLLTNPGERVMRSSLGSPIPRLQFENIIDVDIEVIKEDIRTAILTYEPRVTIEDVQITLQPDDTQITINIYGVVNLNPSDKFTIAIGVTGQGGVQFVRTA